MSSRKLHFMPFDSNMQRVVAKHLDPYLVEYCSRIHSELEAQLEPNTARLSPANWSTHNPHFTVTDSSQPDLSANFFEVASRDKLQTIPSKNSTTRTFVAGMPATNSPNYERYQNRETSPQQYFDAREELLDSDADGHINNEDDIDADADADADADLSDDDEEGPSESEILKELKAKAKIIRSEAYRKWKRHNKNKPTMRNLRAKPQQAQDTTDSPFACTVPRCTFRPLPSKEHFSELARHMHTHYPDAYFCPVCERTLRTSSALRQHLARVPKSARRGKFGPKKEKGKAPSKNNEASSSRATSGENSENAGGGDSGEESVPCAASADAIRYEVGRDHERFNIYWLGVMEKFSMRDTHFEMIAGRRRGEIPH